MGKDYYCEMMLHIPERAHKRIIDGITQSKPLSVELDLAGDPDHKLFVTIGQKKKIEAAIAHGVHRMTLRMSAKQVRHNHKYEGGFLSAMLAAATKFLPAILTGLAAGSASSAGSQAASEEGDGMFLSRRGRTVALQRYAHGDGLLLFPAKNEKIKGFYVKHQGKIYQEDQLGEGILHGLFGKIPLLNILF